ncbi:MAG: pilus assembly protein [Alphaproteobacteria bacterium]|jgi:Flp pilus assembly protein TadG|nr:pilus assembly protein [Alphaproteobacteria bacterium]
MSLFKRIRARFAPWARRQEGAVAVEFALLSFPFFILVFGIIEVSFAFLSASLLEGAAASAARAVVTGQMPQGAGAVQLANQFRVNLCARLVIIPDCDGQVQVESYVVTGSGGFGGFTENPPTEWDFDVGGANDTIVIRATYNYEMLTPMVGHLIAGEDMTLPFTAIVATQNEPF